jgi:hypothetical protein
MMLDPTTMDPLTKLWWGMGRVEIVEERRVAATTRAALASGRSSNGGGALVEMAMMVLVVVLAMVGILLDLVHFHHICVD